MLLQKGSKRKDGGNAVAAGQPVQKKLKFGESKAADVKPQEEEEDESAEAAETAEPTQYEFYQDDTYYQPDMRESWLWDHFRL